MLTKMLVPGRTGRREALRYSGPHLRVTATTAKLGQPLEAIEADITVKMLRVVVRA